MAKKSIREKDVMEVLLHAGFKEVTEIDKTSSWYKKAVEQPSCLEIAAGAQVKK